jgi:ATP-dependent RNA helicase DeaD
VISYASPESAEVYVHRTGRTGRAGKAGIAISLVSGLDIGNFRNLQKINKIPIEERELPGDDALLERTRERLTVKVEQEIRHIPERERVFQIDRLMPLVRSLAASEVGQRELAAIAAAYLRDHRPETTVHDTPEEAPARPPRDSSPQRRSGSGGGRSGGGRSGGGRGRRGGGGGGGGRRGGRR